PSAWRRRGHEVVIRASVGKTALAYVVRLGAKAPQIDRGAIRSEEADRVAGLGEFEVHVQVGPIRGVLGDFIVGPDQQVAARWNRVAIGDAELSFIRQSRAQVETGQVSPRRSRIVNLEPVLEVV